MSRQVFILALFLLSALSISGRAQTPDTLWEATRVIELEAVQLRACDLQDRALITLPALHGGFICSGKKQEVIRLDALPVNLVEKTGRQLFARIPGVFVYDMDGSGNQINIATRGLDPHRSWEFNVRQNGVMTNTDIYGYPASHYGPPMEAIERIELVRGTASLQYGAAFGGMVNYQVRPPDTTRRFAYQTINAIGSWQTASTFHAASGRSGTLSWQAYTMHRSADGYRREGRSTAQAQYGRVQWEAAPRLRISAELSRSQYRYRMPGPLNDSLFRDDPRQATRTRNYYQPDIWIPALQLEWHIATHTWLRVAHAHILGSRSSVMFMGFADRADTRDPQTGRYAQRQVDIDDYHSRTSELRLQHDYSWGKTRHTLAAGLQWIGNNTRRRQLGAGTSGSDYDLSVNEAGFARDVRFLTQNLAAYAEQLFRLSQRFHLSPGIRFENGHTSRQGWLRDIDPLLLPLRLDRRFVLLGISGTWFPDAHHNIYGGWSQAYRPVILAATLPANALERIDPRLRDASGHNAELGLRGQTPDGTLHYDFTLFHLLYRHRMGSIQESDDQGQTRLLRTNTGDSRTIGLEAYMEWQLIRSGQTGLSVFSATARMQGRYIRGSLHRNGENVSIAGNTLESVPTWTSRSGLSLHRGPFQAVLQHSFVDRTFADAFNTVQPPATGAVGLVPSYRLWDLNLGWRWQEHFTLRLSISNLLDTGYFTKRPGGYPGPGIWPSDGRGFLLSVGARI
jgi:Fe(3+) dicitrate transport protein